MGHGFINRGANTTFASRKELAWHKLGKTVDAMTSAEAIKLGGLDFEVGLAPIYLGVENITAQDAFNVDLAIKHITKSKHPAIQKDAAKYMEAKHFPTSFGTYRTDTGHPFGIVGSRYEPVQNIEAFDFFDDVIGQGHAAYETVGALGHGERVFITAKIPETMKVGKEHIDQYLLFSLSHDGKSSITIMFTPIRVVCNNTLSAALGSSANKIRLTHTKNVRVRIEEAKQALGLVTNNGLKLQEVYNRMLEVKMTDQAVGELIINSFGFQPDEEDFFSARAESKFKDVMKYYEIGVGQEGIQGTAWGAFNAITGYQQNVQSYKTADVEFESIMDKGAATVRQKAFNELVSIIR